MPIYKTEGKKNGQQKYRVRINYVDNTGTPRQITRVTYGNAEARNLEARLQREIKEAPPETHMTVKQLYDEYIAAKKHEVRETSLAKTKNRLELHILPYFKNTHLDKLDTAALSRWKSKLSESGLAVSTRRGAFGEFRAMLNYAVRYGWLAKNPLPAVGNFKDAYELNEQEKLHYYTAEQFKKYIACAREKASSITVWGYYVFLLLSLITQERERAKLTL